MSLSDLGISSISCTDLSVSGLFLEQPFRGQGGWVGRRVVSLPGADIRAPRSQESLGSSRGFCHSDDARSISLETVQSMGQSVTV